MIVARAFALKLHKVITIKTGFILEPSVPNWIEPYEFAVFRNTCATDGFFVFLTRLRIGFDEDVYAAL